MSLISVTLGLSGFGRRGQSAEVSKGVWRSFTGKDHSGSHVIDKPPIQREGRCLPTLHSVSAPRCHRPLLLLDSCPAWSNGCCVGLLCLPKCSKGDRMVLWVSSALGPSTQQVLGARSPNSGWGMRICTSSLFRVSSQQGPRRLGGGDAFHWRSESPPWDLRIPPSLPPPSPQVPGSCGGGGAEGLYWQGHFCPLGSQITTGCAGQVLRGHDGAGA